LPAHDYVSPGLAIILPDAAFPNMIAGDTSVPQWPWLRRWVAQNWYTDRRHPTVGFATRDEAAILYNSALLFAGKPCLEIGCWRGWSAVHLALGCGHLDVIDPIFADPEIAADINNAFAAAGVRGKITTHDGFSPAAVDAVARATGRRWSLIFIDGDHEGDAPRQDALAVIPYAAETAMVLFHDLASPYVAAALDAMRDAGWNTMVYQTMQIMGVAWRGDVVPVPHIPDPETSWTLPRHLAGYQVSGWTPPEPAESGAWRPGMALQDQLGAARARAQAAEDDLAKAILERDAALARDQTAAWETRFAAQADEIRQRDAQLQAQQSALEAKDAALKQQTEQAEQKLAAALDRAAAAEASAKAFGQQAKHAEFERRMVAGRLAALESSTIWRIISPVLIWAGDHPRLRRWSRRGAKLLWWSVTLKLFRKLRERRALAPQLPPPANLVLPAGEDVPAAPAARPARDLIPPAARPLLRALYVAEWHEAAGSPAGGFEHYLQFGLARDVSPGPLFNAEIYRARAAAARLPPLAPGQNAVLHWLIHGQAARIVPTDRFSEDFYRKTNPDIAAAPIWGFAHFIQHGLYEGRLPAPEARGFYRPKGGMDQAGHALPKLYRHWLALDFPDRAAHGDNAKFYDRRLEEVVHSDWLARVFADAQAIDPNVGELGDIPHILLPPLHDGVSPLHAELRMRLPATHYDSIICVPWIRTGGADLVAGLLAKALLRIRPEERVLILRTDNPHFERANWLPAEADCVDISDLMQGLAPATAENLLRGLFRGVTARRVFNVNSRLCWATLEKHGVNLAATLATYAYMFCWDQTASGLRTGYPAAFFAGTAGSITAFLTDTVYLRDGLIQMYQLPAAVRDRIVPLFTPAQRAVLVPSIARQVQEGAPANSDKTVLWAGRLDRQKRFDLVQDIARAMPDVEFRCWGAALLDAPPDLDALPPNVIMQGSFNSFDELPLARAGAWLYTALWEGMPTTLIELATRGVAIVASAVGGVPELIQESTGWPIPAEADAAAYVAALREALEAPAEAMRRAEQLQSRVASIYTESVYDAALQTLLDAEPAR
jgi:glycosyltransferase involved in cell wall biosynthesis/predicted O-methyltransferase YrrM